MNEPLHPLDNRLPAMLRGGQRLRGIFNGIASPAIVEMCAFAGFEFLVIDNEHGSANLETTEHMLRAARACNLPTLVRCLEHDIARTLDMGAGGLQVPMVNTAAQAAALVQKVKYPLANGANGLSGQRGSAFSTRAAGYGAFGGPEHSRRSNEGIALVVVIETPEAVATAGKCPGILALGPADEDKYAAWGARYFATVTTGIIMKALKEAALGGRAQLNY
jgi:4-hydroxy-2-oxoheptanedioate aldolase